MRKDTDQGGVPDGRFGTPPWVMRNLKFFFLNLRALKVRTDVFQLIDHADLKIGDPHREPIWRKSALLRPGRRCRNRNSEKASPASVAAGYQKAKRGPS